MVCPKCGEKTAVVDNSQAPTEIYRRRKCKACGHSFYTVEYEVECNAAFKDAWGTYSRYYNSRHKKKNK